MKKVILLGLVLTAFVSLEAQADQKILDCNTSLGPDQQVTVLMTSDGHLKLRELTTSGSMKERALSSEEFESSNLQLRDDGYGSKSRLYKKDGDWYILSEGYGVEEFGYADCFLEQ